MPRREVNPNADISLIDSFDLSNEHIFPKFIKSIRFAPFRHIPDLTVDFIHPITAISGTNRSGKSTILMAIACSHFDFKKRNIQNGHLERLTWSSLMQFTTQDRQLTDWTYFITYKIGKNTQTKRGQRKESTKKWNGIGKKESQFKDRQVIFIDLDRSLPARNFGKKIFNKANNGTVTNISNDNVLLIESYISYILEDNFRLSKLAEHQDKDIYKYKNANEYSSYNAATGEEVLTKMIIDIVEAPKYSLILIDEIEVGLHPKIQRRLMHVIYNIAINDTKQFIITTHSPSILSILPDKARVFIEKNSDGNYKSIPNISVNAALSKMDSEAYPLIDLYCEDAESKRIIYKGLSSIQKDNHINNISSLVNVINIGSANKTYTCFNSHKFTYDFRRIKSGYACVLDGDMRNKMNGSGLLIYPAEECLHFIYSDYCPEKFLLNEYLKQNPNPVLQYNFKESNPHCLFEKMIENSIVTTKEEAFELCWKCFIGTPEGNTYFQELKNFIINMMKKFSPEL